MAKEYSFDMYGQPSLKDPKERKFNVYFSEPEGGITEKWIFRFKSTYFPEIQSTAFRRSSACFSGS